MALTKKRISKEYKKEEINGFLPSGEYIDLKIKMDKIMEKLSVQELKTLYFFIATIDENKN